MSCLNQSYIVKEVDLTQMKAANQLTGTKLPCGKCSMLYTNYKNLLEHLYWRHGTESTWCKSCGLKQWRYALHVCHVLPINDDIIESNLYERESDYCFCGKYVEESAMIGCDGPHCSLQWYHFKCVGIESPPDGDWLCPECVKLKKKNEIGVTT